MDRSPLGLGVSRRTLLIGGAAALLPLRRAGAAPRLTVVSAPNPHVFPLLVAMAEGLAPPLRLVPVPGGAEAEEVIADGGADVLFGMTYVGARLRAVGAAPSLRLVAPVTWRGFWELAGPGVTGFQALKGQTVMVSGPAGGGRGGGGDLIFRAAARRQGVDPERDLKVIYAPIKDAPALLASGEAAAIALPAPASTGMVMQSRMSGGQLERAIDFQAVFSGYRSFPDGQLPLGGLFATAESLGDPDRRQAVLALVKAYAQAAAWLMARPMRYARVAVEAFKEHYAATGVPLPPAPPVVASLIRGDLVYRTDIPMSAIRADLGAWLGEVLGAPPDGGFYAEDLGEVAAAATPLVVRPRPMMRFMKSFMGQ